MRHIIFAVLLFICTGSYAAKAAPPTPSSDCGAGAVVVGSRDAGKVTLGTAPDSNYCTLSFSWPKVPSCATMLESGIDPNGYQVTPRPWAAVTTQSTLLIVFPGGGFAQSPQAGYVISYLCVGQ